MTTQRQYTVKVNHLPQDITKEEIWKHYSQFGHVSSVKVNPGSKESYALVNYDNESSAERAMKQTNGTMIGDRIVSVVCKWKDVAPTVVEQYTLKVTGLSPKVSQEEMEVVCRSYSDYQSLKVNNGYAFVNFSSHEGAMRAMEHLKKCQFYGQCPLVKMQDKNPQQSAAQVRPQAACLSPFPIIQSPHSSETQTSTIKVKINGNEITGEDLKGYFSQFGSVLQVPVIKSGDPDYAYINFASVDGAVAACRKDRVLLNNVPISMKLCDKPPLPALVEKRSKLVSHEDDPLVNLILTTCAFKEIESSLSNVSAQPSKDGRSVHISGDKDKVEMAENIIRLHMKWLQAQIVTESMNLHCQFIPLLKDPQVFQSIEQEHGVEFCIKVADSPTKSIAALSGTIASISSTTYPLTIDCISEYLCSYSSTGVVTWQFYDDDGRFTPMKAADSDAVEKLYQQYHHQSLILPHYTIGKWKYYYNFENMIQENTSTRKKRKIQRISAPESCASLCLSCRGLQDRAKASIASFQEKLESLVISKTLKGCSADTFDPLMKLAKSFCVKVDSVGDSIVLSGDSEYLTKVILILTEKLNNLQSASISTSFPPEWEPQSKNIELKTVQTTSDEWVKIVSAIKKTMLDAKILKIERIQNKFLYAKYELCRKRMHDKNKGMVNEKRLFHGSSDVSPHKIYTSEHGFDFRYGGSGVWGKGAYFAVNASYSGGSYAFPSSHGRQIFMAYVLTGESKEMPSNPSLVTPPSKDGSEDLYDSVNGVTGSSQVYIVYDHDKCYPAYLITLQ